MDPIQRPQPQPVTIKADEEVPDGLFTLNESLPRVPLQESDYEDWTKSTFKHIPFPCVPFGQKEIKRFSKTRDAFSYDDYVRFQVEPDFVAWISLLDDRFIQPEHLLDENDTPRMKRARRIYYANRQDGHPMRIKYRHVSAEKPQLEYDRIHQQYINSQIEYDKEEKRKNEEAKEKFTFSNIIILFTDQFKKTFRESTLLKVSMLATVLVFLWEPLKEPNLEVLTKKAEKIAQGILSWTHPPY